MPSNVNSCRLGRQASRGFTLIEVLIAVIVVGVLAAIALPSFMAQIRASRRADAVATLSLIQQAQERWRANQPQYAAVLMTTPATDCDTEAERVANNCLGIAPVAGARYTYALSGAAATAYTITATAVAGAGQTSDSAQGTPCNVLTITVAGATTTNSPAPCFRQ
jgi:type IV pilus assembly protein PilE